MENGSSVAARRAPRPSAPRPRPDRPRSAGKELDQGAAVAEGRLVVADVGDRPAVGLEPATRHQGPVGFGPPAGIPRARNASMAASVELGQVVAGRVPPQTVDGGARRRCSGGRRSASRRPARATGVPMARGTSSRYARASAMSPTHTKPAVDDRAAVEARREERCLAGGDRVAGQGRRARRVGQQVAPGTQGIVARRSNGLEVEIARRVPGPWSDGGGTRTP